MTNQSVQLMTPEAFVQRLKLCNMGDDFRATGEKLVMNYIEDAQKIDLLLKIISVLIERHNQNVVLIELTKLAEQSKNVVNIESKGESLEIKITKALQEICNPNGQNCNGGSSIIRPT